MLSVSSPSPTLLAALDCSVAGKPPSPTAQSPEAAAFAILLSSIPVAAGLPGLDFAPEGDTPLPVADADGEGLPETGNFLPLALPVVPLMWGFTSTGAKPAEISLPAKAPSQMPALKSAPASTVSTQPSALIELPSTAADLPVGIMEPFAPAAPITARQVDTLAATRPDAVRQAKDHSKPVQITVRDAAPAKPVETPDAVQQPVDSGTATMAADAPSTGALSSHRLNKPDNIAPTEFGAIEAPARTDHASARVSATPAPPATDIAAVLDKLAAAREALMPSQTEVEVEHIEFGPVSIRFDQSAAGQLSVELSAADPDLKRAVAAVAQADLASNGGNEGASNRGTGHYRDGLSDRGGGNSAGSDTRSQGDRASPDRRGQPTPQPQRHPAENRSGTFA